MEKQSLKGIWKPYTVVMNHRNGVSRKFPCCCWEMVISWTSQSLKHNETEAMREARGKKSSNLGMKWQPDHRTEIIMSIEHPGLWCFRKPRHILGAGPLSAPKLTWSPLATVSCDTGTHNQAQGAQALPRSPCSLGSEETRSSKSAAM